MDYLQTQDVNVSMNSLKYFFKHFFILFALILTGTFLFQSIACQDWYPARMAYASEPPVSGIDEEEQLWDIVKDSTISADLSAYLDAYPNGRFRAVARSRIMQLERMEQEKLRQREQQPAYEPEQNSTDEFQAQQTMPEKAAEPVMVPVDQEDLAKKRERDAWLRYQQQQLREKRAEAEKAREEARIKSQNKKQKLDVRAKIPYHPESTKQLENFQPGAPWTEPVTGMEFVWIKGGCFMMGQSSKEKKELLRKRGSDYQQYYQDEFPAREVCVDGFYMGKYEVTQGEWSRVMDFRPARFTGSNRLPVEMVSWFRTEEFTAILSNSVAQYRLPTEAEWEYAARAGSDTLFSFGDTITADQVNYDGNYPYGGASKGKFRQQTSEVGTFPANAWGLYDMHGNVMEWTSDWYEASYYTIGTRDNPTGPSFGRGRVVRGGSWYAEAARCRSANRRSNDPQGSGETLGFRLVFVSGK